jgi:transposase
MRANHGIAIKLFQELEDKNRSAENIYVIADNARYYKSTLVREYLKNSRIRLILLPPYAPNLNLIERVWKFSKDKVIKGDFYEKFHQFRQAVQNSFKDMDKYKDELKSLLTD